jgi:hypothetical protein
MRQPPLWRALLRFSFVICFPANARHCGLSACFTRAASAASSLAITPRAVTDGVAVDLQPLVNANAGSTGALTI